MSKPASKGLSDEALTQVAQAKFEAQEDGLRVVARHAMSLLRDINKMTGPECTKKVAETRKALLKYEMRDVNVAELQQKAVRMEIERLVLETARCKQDAEAEGAKMEGLQRTLEKERMLRKRHESCEALALEINRKRTRTDCSEAITTVTSDIETIGQQRQELESLVVRRNQTARLLQYAVADLRRDLQLELNTVVEQGGSVADAAGGHSSEDIVEVIS
uniref:Uncharacterized protein n=1 Tax=Noctiluca scintillans TaxID=2966 RepID=A0A7S1A268_NOCSC|mmetsp:Transcript_28479/g.75187  ORF Transcript_28479/g.75187 Transcript_28479/m.75187 type:complete len:219 (+) Transcript_28479:74-730(+)